MSDDLTSAWQAGRRAYNIQSINSNGGGRSSNSSSSSSSLAVAAVPLCAPLYLADDIHLISKDP